MLLTSLSVPDNTVQAAEVSAVEETEMLEESAGADEIVESSESKASEEAAEPDVMNPSEEMEAAQSNEMTETSVTETIDLKEEEETSIESVESETLEMTSTMDEKSIEEDTSLSNGSKPEETEDFDSEVLNEADETGNYIINGDFENETEAWTIENITSRDNSADGQNIGSNSSKCMYIWSENGTNISMSQSITLGEGIYKASIEAGGNYQAEAFSLIVKRDDGSVIEEKKFHAGTGNWGDWYTEETNSFELSSESSITIEILGNLNEKEQIYLDNVKLFLYSMHTIEELTDLYNSTNENKEECYTIESWNQLASALATAKGYIDNNSSGSEEDINTAYESLKKAINELLIRATIYYFIGDTEQEVGVVKYGNVSSSKTETENWIWDTTAAYVMDRVENTGWYSVELYLPAKEIGTGFAIYLKDKTMKYQCVPNWEGNPEHYEKLISGKASSYAIKDIDDTCTLYQGTGDIVSAIDRNVVLYVYSKEGTPSIVTVGQLSNVFDGNGVQIVEQLTESHKDAENYYYDMTPDTENWYTLTFSAPDADKVCDLYTKDTDNNYTLAVSFMNGETSSENSVDFTPVFDGNIYYNNGGFYKSKELATGVTLADLEELYQQAEALEETRYTEESWAALAEKMAAAKTLIDGNSTDIEAITAAFEALKSARENLVSAGIRFYYYAGDTEGKKVGVYHWSKNNNISSTAANKDWIFWDVPMFEMTPAEYPG